MGTRRVFLSVTIALLGTLAWAVSPAQATFQVFAPTGGEQTFVVPSGVTLLKVLVIGGSGGDGGGAGGAAAEVTADLEVTPGTTLYVEVGGVGVDSGEGGTGGFNGGAAGGGTGAGGGGGASDIRLLPRSMDLSPDTRLVVAAGGGGGGGEGGEPGANGGNAGSAGETSSGGNEGGGAGTASEGGAGGIGCGGTGSGGELGQGGAGSTGEFGSNGGGGGGGGFYGGGGGGGACVTGGGGGGGGSSFMPVGGELEIASPSTTPRIVITYIVPPSISIATPANGAAYTQGQTVNASYSCAPDEEVTIESCVGPVANGAAIDTLTLGLHNFKVEAEDSEGNESSKTVSYTVVAPSPGGTPPLGGGSQQPGPPNTIIDSHPRKVIKTAKKRVKVKFSFHSPTAGASFECKLDKGAYAACASPKRYKVKAGKHKFSVRAVKDGSVDPTPASFKFKVVKAS